MKNNYTPQPVETSNFELPKELMALSEQMAQNVHEVWAAGRVADGWQYGEYRDDAKKHHPSLVAYEDLTDTEKNYDRRTSIETLKFIVTQGFEIIKRH